MPRLWVTKAVDVQVGRPLPPQLAAAATALAPLQGAGLPGGVAAVRVGKDELTLQLGGGLEVRLGDTGDLRLKLAIARRILRADRCRSRRHRATSTSAFRCARCSPQSLKSEVELEG